MILTEFYDGKNEFLHIIGGKKDESPLSKQLKYKINSDKSIDIDVSKWAVNGFVHKYEYLRNGVVTLQYNCTRKYEIILEKNEVKEIYRGDTMTSFATIFKYYINNINPIYDQYFRGINGLAKQILKEEFKALEAKIDPEIIEFAQLVHTQGNLIPIPLHFNVERSGQFANCDLWDLVMKAVYEWYEKYKQKDDKPLINLLDNKNKNLERSLQSCKKWLAHFENWEEFVLQNHLESYVDENKQPIEFWEKHFEQGNTLQNIKSREEFMNFIRLLNKIIRERNYILIRE